METFNKLGRIWCSFDLPVKLHVVLYRPQIPHNAGAIGRSCLGYNAKLHLVGPMGFSLEDSEVKRAGLDYWKHVDLATYDNWADFSPLLPTLGNTYYFTKKGTVSLLDTKFDFHARLAKGQNAKENEPKRGLTVVFGSEITGLSDIWDLLPQDRLVYLPMAEPNAQTPHGIRSFNLACTASVGLWEVFRQFHETHLKDPAAFEELL